MSNPHENDHQTATIGLTKKREAELIGGPYCDRDKLICPRVVYLEAEIDRLRAALDRQEAARKLLVDTTANECRQRRLLKEDNDRLRAVLEPFAKAAAEVRPVGSIPPSDVFIWKPYYSHGETPGITQQDLLNAREALEDK